MMSKRKNTGFSAAAFLNNRMDSEAGKAALHATVSFLAGMISSRAMIFNGLSPFGIAAVAASSKSESLFVLLGAALGYLLPGGPEYAVRYLAASASVLIFKWLFSGFEEIAGHPAFGPALAGIASALTGAAVVVTNGISLPDTLSIAAETLICACAAMFFERAFPLLRKPGNIWGFGRRDLVCAVVTYGVLLLAFLNLKFSGISFGRILAVLSVLIAARYGNEAGGCVTGAALGLILGLGGNNAAGLAGSYAFAGLIAGVFSPTGRFGCAVAFILANAVTGAGSGGSPAFITGLYEVMAATLIFMLLPEKFLGRFSSVLFPVRDLSGKYADHSRTASRLFSASSALREIADTVSQVGSRLQKITESDVGAVYTDAADLTCNRCGMRMYCWGTAYNDTMDAFNAMTPNLRKNGSVEREDVPHHFAGRCCRLGDLLTAINRCYGEHTARLSAQRKTDMLRGLLTGEFEGLSAYLKQLGDEVGEISRFSRNDSELRAAFASCGLTAEETLCGIDEKGRLRVDARIEKRGKTVICREELLGELAAVCGRELEGPVVGNDRHSLCLSFLQKPTLSCSFGKAVLPKTGEKLCGDAAETLIDEQGRAVMILSDGMGCGGRAAVDSNLAVRLMSRLLLSGFGYESALHMVNTAMILKSGEESFATLDIVSVDLFSGDAEFLKAGSPASYVRRCGRVERVMNRSMPVGILQEVNLERAQARMRRGDVIAVVSDGVVTGEDGWLIKAVGDYPGGNPVGFAQEIAQQARKGRSDGHDDDITVLIAEIS